MRRSFDFLVVGGGIAGAACAYELSRHGRVLVIEREASLAYHTTGRSAAISMESYGNPVIRQLTAASRAFFENPPADTMADLLWAPRGALILCDQPRLSKLVARHEAVVRELPSTQWLDSQAVKESVPFLDDKWIAGIYEPHAFDLDVHAIHTAFLKGARQRGGSVQAKAEILSAQRHSSSWVVRLEDGEVLEAGTIVNAAGAWADVVAQRCGTASLGIRSLQRTVVVVDPGRDVSRCPYIGTVDEQFFIKPESGRLLVSPCDETPSEPGDALPDEMGVAMTMDRLESGTTLRPGRILNRWAGLRIFVPDRSPLVGADPTVDGLIWCAALGGYGIQTAPAMARLCAALAIGSALPPGLEKISAAAVAPTSVLDTTTRKVVAVAELE